VLTFKGFFPERFYFAALGESVFHQQSHFLRDLFIRESGSRAVSADVSFAFIPFIRLQKESRLAEAAGLFFASEELTGRFMSWPSARREARPFSLRPPSGFLPSDRVHAPPVL
jgi:hypothetical protein